MNTPAMAFPRLNLFIAPTFDWLMGLPMVALSFITLMPIRVSVALNESFEDGFGFGFGFG